MALKPTIYKININLSDLDKEVYESCALTIAQHPSENNQRLLARLLAFLLNYQENLSFTKGLSDVDVPDIWLKDDFDKVQLWIEVGEPNAERIKKACRQADAVKIYSFNSKSDVWWKQSQKALTALDAKFYRFDSEQIERVAALLSRTMELSVTITDGICYLSSETITDEVSLSSLSAV